MKGIIEIPSKQKRVRAYNALLSRKDDIPLDRLMTWVRWTRFDPRLGEILVDYFLRQWRELSPVEINFLNKKNPWPATLGVVLEQARISKKIKQDISDFGLFDRWIRLVMEGVERADNAQYFIGLRSFAGREMKRDVERSLHAYKKWGYFGREIWVNKAPADLDVTLVSKETRRSILDRHLAQTVRIDIKTYRALLGGKISRRQAERDLESHPRLTPRGKTKGRYYSRI